MYYEYLFSVPQNDDLDFPDDPDGNSTVPLFLTKLGAYEDKFVYFIHALSDPMGDPNLSQASMIGVWDEDGILDTTVYAFDRVEYEKFRPLGNQRVTEYDENGDPISSLDGVATKQLEYSHGAGWTQRQMQDVPAADTTALYPADDQPIVLDMERWWDDTPGWEGNAWRSTIEFSDPTRPPNARAIGIYDSSWNYLYTTGAFIWTDTGDVDEEGNPIFKWQTETPVGRATPDPESVYYALLYGSLQEGLMVLIDTDETRTDLFWDHDQQVGTLASGVNLLYHDGALIQHPNFAGGLEALIYG